MSGLRQILVILVLGVIAGAGWVLLDAGSEKNAANGANGRTARSIGVEVTQARRGTSVDVIEAVGSTRANQSVEIVPDASGRITEIGFEPGQQVAEGSVLVRLDNEIEEANVMEARAALEDARAQYERARTLLPNRTVSQATVDQLEAGFKAAQARLDAAQRRLADRAVKAPFSGTVGLNRVDVGARVDDGTVVTTLDDLTVLELEFAIPEIYYGRIRQGLAVEATSAAFPGRVFEGSIIAVDSRVDNATRAFRVRAAMPNPDRALPSGLFMLARVTIDERADAVLIPEQAIIAEGDATFAYRVVDGRAERVAVRLGRRTVGEVEVVEGLDAGDEVVVAGLQRLRDGAEVRVLNASDTAPPTS